MDVMDRVKEKFMKYAEHRFSGRRLDSITPEEIELMGKTMKGILRAELGLLPGAERRPIVTPRKQG